MANTEGLTDEVVSSMLAMPTPDEERLMHSRTQPRFPHRALARREQMMESLGDGEMPSARVIRSSKAPKVHSSTAIKNRAQSSADMKEQSFTPTPPSEAIEQTQKVQDCDTDGAANKILQRPVIKSDSIRERPAESNNIQIASSTSQPKRRESRFKQRQLKKDGSLNATVGGFPSLDFAPVGSLTRKGRLAKGKDSSSHASTQNISAPSSTMQHFAKSKLPQSPQRANNDISSANESMLANMSIDEIRDGVEEVKSILSAESIAFLRKRGKQKRTQKVTQQTIDAPVREDIKLQNNDTSRPSLTKEMELELEEKKIREGKEKVAELLTNIRTPEDMDLAYNEAIELGLAPSLPTSSLETNQGHSTDERISNLHTATSLLRSTSFRQRLLGARNVCNILEEDVRAMLIERQRHSFSVSTDGRKLLQKAYPPLLPVAIRCILDESLALAHTSSGMALLSQGLRSVHCLMKLFVHPYHCVNVNPSTTEANDPFQLYANCFMSDISHVPSGAELYPPTTITPIEKSGTNGSCYRADSSAASAESDSKVFYNDPSWILLSRMRILPCLSDVIAVLSKEVSSGSLIHVATLQSICGILAMLAVRLPGAALAIANHKGLLPFLASYCLGPRSDESSALFDTQNALPFLILLCNLARQSEDVAGLDIPFGAIMSNLQGILCIQADNKDELEVQMWCLTLLRILVRYGLATENIQSLVTIAATHVAVQKPQNSICVHYLSLFAAICNASNAKQSQSGSQLSSIPEQDNSLPMTAIWLSSSVTSCTTSLPVLLRDCSSDNRDSVLKMASSQLQLLSSFAAAENQSTTTTSVPILSKESCRSIIDEVLETDLLKQSLEISLGWSYRASWVETEDESGAISLEREAISCAFVVSFMALAAQTAVDGEIAPKLLEAVLNALNSVKSQNEARAHTSETIFHVARQSWLVEAEYSVLKYLCKIGVREKDRSLVMAFALSLVGRLNVGHEAIAYFIFGQKALFMEGDDEDGCTDLFRSLFLGELSISTRDRKAQLEHSDNLFNKGALNSLRCTADFNAGVSNAREERFFLPVGATWILNVLSSTITSDEAHSEDRGITNATGIVKGALSLLVQLEASCPLQVNAGTKLYHLCNVCLFPEDILRDDVIATNLNSLFQRYDLSDSAVVRDFIKECFHHSRLSRAKKSTDDEPTGTDPSLAAEKLLIDDEMRALDDFVGDLCESFIEYGGQYVICARFIRVLLRHDFPTKITKSVAEKLQPILNLLTIEGETRESLQLSLVQSMRGGLPSMDSSSRDSSVQLDVFTAALKKADKLTRRDYFYLLAISFLSRNLASSFQRCECGLEAMKKRLSGVTPATFFDVVHTSKQLLCDKRGTKESVIGCVIERCLDDSTDLGRQDEETQQLWQWNPSDESAVWERTLCFLAETD